MIGQRQMPKFWTYFLLFVLVGNFLKYKVQENIFRHLIAGPYPKNVVI